MEGFSFQQKLLSVAVVYGLIVGLFVLRQNLFKSMYRIFVDASSLRLQSL